jgi:hypothetical protein
MAEAVAAGSTAAGMAMTAAAAAAARARISFLNAVALPPSLDSRDRFGNTYIL